MVENTSFPNGISPGNFFNYFKECYKLDNKEFVVSNVLSTKYKYKWFVSKEEELLNLAVPCVPYDNRYLEDLEKEIELYKLEKKLFYSCFYVLGKADNAFGKDKRICAPLLLFPAEIINSNDEKLLEIDIQSFTINPGVLSIIEYTDNTAREKFVNALNEIVLDKNVDFITLKGVFDQYSENILASELLLFPQVWPEKRIKSYFNTHDFTEGEFDIIPAAGTVFVEKSESSLHVLNDLEAIASQNSFSDCLGELVHGAQVDRYAFDFSFYKSRLNESQYNALRNVYRYKNSVIVGPPGTGKTYTITSIISDAVINNKSVLVVSKTRQAVEVLRQMLQEDFQLKDYLIHTTGNKYKISLKAKIRKYLSGVASRKTVVLNEFEISELFNAVERLEHRFEKIVQREVKLSDLEFAVDPTFIDVWKKFFLKHGFGDGTKLWKTFHQLNTLLKKLDIEISTYSKRKIQANILRSSSEYRKDIAKFYDALETSGFTDYKRLINKVNHSNILRVFPIWLAHLSELNTVLPLQKELFDVVIIDEATQCDIASALPAIYRAKRSVVVGDPNQLRHYSFVSEAQQRKLQQQFELPFDKIFDFRNRSILDFFISKVSNQDQITFLREHFRSTPSLIEFSNEQFYDGQLEVLKSTPLYRMERQIELVEAGGRRNKKGVNEVEATCLMEKLDSVIRTYEAQSKPPSLGVISPFNSQVVYLNKLIKERYDLDLIKKFNLICGTPYAFQGSEREIVFISFCVCDHTHHSAFLHVNKPEVLNVAITRAKSYQYVFKSVKETTVMKSDSLLARYFSFIRQFSSTEVLPADEDVFQEQVVEALQKLGLSDIKCGYPVAGSLLDILVVHKKQHYFIDLIGYPGQFKEAFSLERYKTLSRTGIHSLPVHYSYWQKNREEVIRRLKAFIGI